MTRSATLLRSSLLGTTALLVLLLAPAPAHAREAGYYLGVSAGASFPESADYERGALSNTVDSNVGFNGAFLAGYDFGNGFRLQGDAFVNLNTVKDISGVGSGAPEDGNINTYALMADLLFDMRTGTKFTPYIGGGLGGAYVKADGVDTLLSTTVSDSDLVLAYQGIAGVDYSWSKTWKFGLEYRFFALSDPSFSSALGKIDSENQAHSLMLSARYSFQ